MNFLPQTFLTHFVRENLQHEAYSLPRQRLYIGGDKYLAALDKALSEGKQWILVDGPSGGGKSALLANWLQSVRDHEKILKCMRIILAQRQMPQIRISCKTLD